MSADPTSSSLSMGHTPPTRPTPSAPSAPLSPSTASNPTSSAQTRQKSAYTLTPAQLALQAERKAAKLAKKAAEASGVRPPIEVGENGKVLGRAWKSVGSKGSERGQGEINRVKVVTWNMLAQTLVRRELFPGSDCLRWGDRKPMLLAELAMHASSGADVICLQECDRLRDLLPSVPGHIPIQARGPGKLHGLVVLYKPDRFSVRTSASIQLDLEHLSLSSPELDLDHVSRASRRGGSRTTKNMALIVALQQDDGRGIIIATTHLFWHPKFEYERARQVVVLLRAIRRLQEEHDCLSWPVVLAGDLNTQPCEATYQLLSAPHDPLHLAYARGVDSSRLVHTSIDTYTANEPSLPTPLPSSTASVDGTGVSTPTTGADKDDDGEGEGQEKEDELPDSHEQSIANTRAPIPADGLMSMEELVKAAQEAMPGVPRVSAYASTQWTGTESKGATFDTRSKEMIGGGEGKGGGEPVYTCFTPLFRLTLDYLFLFGSGEVSAVLDLPKTEELGAGLPRKGICASDHLAVGCEVVW